MIPFPNKKYSIIYADPPWKYRDKRLGRGGAEYHYSTMSMREIMELPVESIAADDCALFMWATWPLLDMRPSPFTIMREWGFTYKTIGFDWVKTRKLSEVDQAMMFADESFDYDGEKFTGCGNYTRSNTEPCLLAISGKMKAISHSVHSLIWSPVGRHSQKPPETRSRIVELFGDLPRIELFARAQTAGWDVWGNEA